MAQNITIGGASYSDVPAIEVPKTGGGTATFYDIDVVPDYVKEEAETTIAKSFSHGNLGRTIRFIATSDSHNDANGLVPQVSISNKHCGQAIKYIADRIGLDFVAFLGDATWAGVSTAAGTIAELRKDILQFNDFISDGYKGLPNVRLVGNHDQCKTSDATRLFNSGAYNLFGRYCFGEKDTIAGYGYFDLDNSKVRVIYMNTSDIPSSTAAGTYLGVTQEQKNWLCETLIDTNTKSDAEDWKILILSHAPLDLLSGIANEILIAYTNGGTYGSYTFTNHDAQIISNVHGHVHCYSYGYIGDKIRRFCIPNSNFSDNNHYKNNPSYAQWADQTTYPKTANSGKDTAFSLVTIDLDSNICYVDNYGAGIDREFSCDYQGGGITNLIDTIGINADMRLGSTGVMKAGTGYYTMNYIPYQNGDVIRLKGFVVPPSTTSAAICTYSAESETSNPRFGYVTTTTGAISNFTLAYDANTGILTLTANNNNDNSYLRTGFMLTGALSDCIVTKNEEIPS